MQNLKGNLLNIGMLVAVAAITILILGIRAYLPFAFANSTSSESNVVATANVEAVCFINLSVNSIDFGNMFPTENVPTTQNVVDYDNGGNIAANVLMYGTTWNNDANSLIFFGSSNTTYSPTYNTPWATAFNAGNYLFNSIQPTAIVVPAPSFSNPSTNTPIYFGLAIPEAQTAGQYNQIIYIENSC
ncbi:MAG: hypothetical protein QXN59_02275 [Candidatus Micrarchaeaceae archaeon]